MLVVWFLKKRFLALFIDPSLFTTLIFPSIQGSLLASQRCSSSFNCDCGDDGMDETCTCDYYDENGDPVTDDDITCDNPITLDSFCNFDILE